MMMMMMIIIIISSMHHHATHSMYHPKADIHRLYLPRSSGGSGLTQLELSYKTSTIGLFQYLNLSDGWMLLLEHLTNRMSTNRYLLWIPQR